MRRLLLKEIHHDIRIACLLIISIGLILLILPDDPTDDHPHDAMIAIVMSSCQLVIICGYVICLLYLDVSWRAMDQHHNV